MIPINEVLSNEITEVDYGSKTYKIEVIEDLLSNTETEITVGSELGVLILDVSKLNTSNTISPYRLNGYIDGVNSIKQSIYCILSTERYKFPIYSWDYGVELMDLIGQPKSYVMSELPRRIEEALKQDNRVQSVTDFEFEQNGKKLHTKFTVVTNIGNISSELEVGI